MGLKSGLTDTIEGGIEMDPDAASESGVSTRFQID